MCTSWRIEVLMGFFARCVLSLHSVLLRVFFCLFVDTFFLVHCCWSESEWEQEATMAFQNDTHTQELKWLETYLFIQSVYHKIDSAACFLHIVVVKILVTLRLSFSSANILFFSVCLSSLHYSCCCLLVCLCHHTRRKNNRNLCLCDTVRICECVDMRWWVLILTLYAYDTLIET